MQSFSCLHLDDLSAKEREVLKAYKLASSTKDGSLACFTLNRMLEHSLRPSEMGGHGLSAQTLDNIFERCPVLDANTTVFRVIGTRTHLPETETSSRFRNRSFWSTSIEESAAMNFLKLDFDKALGALLRLELPAGLAEYNMSMLDGGNDHEQELLLPRNTLWTVTECHGLVTPALAPSILAGFKNILSVTLTATL